MVLGSVVECMRTTPLVACKILLGFPPLYLWIRKLAFKATCRIQNHSSHGGQMFWELVEQLGIQIPCSARPLLKKMVLRKTIKGGNQRAE